jgi:hypothetical protein
MWKRSRYLGTFVIALFLGSCAASGPRITTQSNPVVDFSGFNTFNFMSPMGTDRPGGVTTPLSMMLAGAVTEELQSRGFALSDEPDLLINVFINTEQRVDVRQTPTATGFYGYRRNRYGTWGGYRTEVRQYTEGTMVIDLIDARQNMLAWEGIAEKRLSSNASQINQQQVDAVVGAILADFPYAAR